MSVADPGVVGPGPTRRVARWGARTTPGRLRLMSIAAVAVTLAAAAVSVVGAVALNRSTERLRDRSGPALVATQEVFSSLAEADAAATAAYLSGRAEDGAQRRRYEDALARSAQQLTEVARLTGDTGPGRAAVQDLAARITSYAGLVEAARARELSGTAGGDAILAEAIDVARNGIAPDIAALHGLTTQRLAADDGAGRAWLVVGVIALSVALVVLVATQVHVARVSRRLLNLPLVAASLLLVAVGAWLAVATSRQAADLRGARERGLASIALTGQVQTLAYRVWADESLALVGGVAGAAGSADGGAPAGASTVPGAGSVAVAGAPGGAVDRTVQLADTPVTPESVEAARSGRLDSGARGLLFDLARAADGDRERAAVADVLTRWAGYAAQQAGLGDARRAGDQRQAVQIALGPAGTSFDEFNDALDRVLDDNRAQFEAGLSAAHDRLRGLPEIAVAAPALAALLALWGLQLRIDEYR